MLPFNEINFDSISVGTPEKKEFTDDKGVKMSNLRTPIQCSDIRGNKLKIEYGLVTCRGIIKKDSKYELPTLTVMAKFKYFNEGKTAEEDIILQSEYLKNASVKLTELNTRLTEETKKNPNYKMDSEFESELEKSKQEVVDYSKEVDRLTELISFMTFMKDLRLKFAQVHHPYAPMCGIRKPFPEDHTASEDFIKPLLSWSYDDKTFALDKSRDPVQWIPLTYGRDQKTGELYSTKFIRPDPENPTGPGINVPWEDLENVEFDCIPVIVYDRSNGKPNGGNAFNVKARMMSAIILDIREKASSYNLQSGTVARVSAKDPNLAADLALRFLNMGTSMKASTTSPVESNTPNITENTEQLPDPLPTTSLPASILPTTSLPNPVPVSVPTTSLPESISLPTNSLPTFPDSQGELVSPIPLPGLPPM